MDEGLALEAEEHVPELPLEVVQEGGIVGPGLQADGFEPLGHGDGVEVRLGLDDEGEPRHGPHPLPDLGKLPLGLCGCEIGRHGPHPLADPPHDALAEMLLAEGVAILTYGPDADGASLPLVLVLLLFLLLFVLVLVLGWGSSNSRRRRSGGRLDEQDPIPIASSVSNMRLLVLGSRSRRGSRKRKGEEAALLHEEGTGTPKKGTE